MNREVPLTWRARVLRSGLVFAAAGLAVAITLYILNPWLGFPEWTLVLWPAAVGMLALSGISAGAAVFWTVAIVASNAVLYFILGIILAIPVILVRSVLDRFVRKVT